MKNSPKVLGLDISTKTIGWALFDIKTQDLLELTHVSPRPKNKDTEENKMLELILKSEVFKTKVFYKSNLTTNCCIPCLNTGDCILETTITSLLLSSNAISVT